MSIHLIYGSDDNYWFPTAISAASAAYGCSCAIEIHLFDAGVKNEHYAEYEKIIHQANPKAVLERHVLDSKMFEGFVRWKGSVVTYSRMFIQDILPDLDWAIYVDGDTLWLGDIARLWELRDDEMLIQASVDPPMPLEERHPDEEWYEKNGLKMSRHDYLCMGLMLVNLKALRKLGISNKIKDFMEKHPRPPIVDQTVLNYVCHGYMSELPKEWGVFSIWHGNVDLSKDTCIHYVDDLPWRRDKLNRLISDVVLIWYEFSERVLGMNLRYKYLTKIDWQLRRGIFVLLKHLQWIVKLNVYVHSRLRNTHGLSQNEFKLIRGRFP